jgi:hypothetical protein
MRRFLAEEAPFDFAVVPFTAVASLYTETSLRAQAKIIMQAEATAAYGADHPQAQDPGALKLTRKKKQKGTQHG